MDLAERARRVESRQDLVAFVEALRRELELNGARWENPTLERYLEALGSWTEDMTGYFQNRGEPIPDEPTWGLVAQMLYAGHLYE
jgi:hypothetical protein